MPGRWRRPLPVLNDAVICTCYVGDPAFGPVLHNGLARVLLGWDHPLDDPAELLHGQIWCWVSQDPVYPKFQCFRTSGNRSNIPGQRVDCGVVNYSMVRMIHPWWAENGVVPRDMAWKPDYDDKARLRALYHKLVGERNGDQDNGVVLERVELDDPDHLPLFIEQTDTEGYQARNLNDVSNKPQDNNAAVTNIKRKRKTPKVPRPPRKLHKSVRPVTIAENEDGNLADLDDMILAAQADDDDVKHDLGYFDLDYIDDKRSGTAWNPMCLDLDDDCEQISEEIWRASNELDSGAQENAIDLDAASTPSRTQIVEAATSIFGNGIARVEVDGNANEGMNKTSQEPEDLTILESQVVNLGGNEDVSSTPRTQDALTTDDTEDAQTAEPVSGTSRDDTTLVNSTDVVFIGDCALL